MSKPHTGPDLPANRLHLLPRHREILLALLREHLPGIEVWAYGSRVNGQSHDGSDLDLVLRSPDLQKIPIGQVADLREALRESNIPFLVEARDWACLPKGFHPEIEREYVVLVEKEKRDDASEWPTIRFTDAVQINPPVRLERGKAYPFVDMATLNAGFRCAYALERRVYSGGGTRFRSGDTLMARITPCLENGKIARYCAPDPTDPAHGSTEFIVIRGRPDVTDHEFAYYLTQWGEVRHYAIGQMTGTSGRQRVPTKVLDHLAVTIPPLPEQRAIAHILGTLDDKIELNRRMNETLESMARALFKSWFVDFDPVRAKVEGRDTGLPKPISDLFPDRLVDSERGEIPEGWKIKSLRDCFHLAMGQSPPGNTYNDRNDGLLFFQGRTDFGFRFPENRKFCTAPTRIAQPGDTLVSVRAPVGDINMAWEECCIGRGVAALRHQSGSSSFTYYSAQAVQNKIREYEDTGTVFGAINRKQLEALQMLEPSPDIVNAFDAQAGPVDVRIRNNVAESRILTTLRETLLPKLISGEIRLRDATGQADLKAVP